MLHTSVVQVVKEIFVGAMTPNNAFFIWHGLENKETS